MPEEDCVEHSVALARSVGEVRSEPGGITEGRPTRLGGPSGVSLPNGRRLPNAVESFWHSPNGTRAPITTLATDQAATCWITGPADGSLFFASNAGGSSLTGLGSFGGPLVATSTTSTDPGTVDAAISSDGQYLYAQTGGHGIVDEFHINFDGSLTEVGFIAVPNAIGGEGIAAS
jgi:hypothetical protein